MMKEDTSMVKQPDGQDWMQFLFVLVASVVPSATIGSLFFATLITSENVLISLIGLVTLFIMAIILMRTK